MKFAVPAKILDSGRSGVRLNFERRRQASLNGLRTAPEPENHRFELMILELGSLLLLLHGGGVKITPLPSQTQERPPYIYTLLGQ